MASSLEQEAPLPNWWHVVAWLLLVLPCWAILELLCLQESRKRREKIATARTLAAESTLATESTAGAAAESKVEGASAASIAAVAQPGGRKVELFNDAEFGKLRRATSLADDFLNEAWRFEDLRSGGGKGGCLLAYVGDEFIVKELDDADHQVLLDVAARYIEHIRGGDSLLSVILMHFRDIVTNRRFFVMRNALGSGPFESIYDLKGCADDKTLTVKGKAIRVVNKRIWHIHMWCGQCLWTPDRVRYYEGKVAARQLKMLISGESRAQVLAAIHRDTEWLAREHLMDYSLLLGSKAAPRNSRCGSDSRGSQDGAVGAVSGRRCILHRHADGHEGEVYVSIIDFLGRWSTSKVIAHYIKVAERNKATIHPEPYAHRFRNHFGQLFQSRSDKDNERL